MIPGGIKNGEMFIMMGRRTGKSTLYKQMLVEAMKTKFEKVDESIVDGVQWYTITTLHMNVAAWLRTQPKDTCFEHSISRLPQRYFDIHEKLYTMMELKFQ